MKVEKVFVSFRFAINDVTKATNSDDRIYPILLLAVHQLFSDVPELRIDADLQEVMIPLQYAALGDDVPIPDTYLQPCVDWMAHRYFMGDSGAARDENRSKEHLASYRRVMMAE